MKSKHSKRVFLPVAIFESTYNIGTTDPFLFQMAFLRGLCILVIAKNYDRRTARPFVGTFPDLLFEDREMK